MKFSRCIAGCVLVCGLAAAQPARSSLEVLKSQARMAADSVLASSAERFRVHTPIRIRVARSEQRLLTENAFLESFKARGIECSFVTDDSVGSDLFVQPLAQEVRTRDVGNGNLLQSVRSVFDVRMDRGGTSEMIVSGLEYSREDTLNTTSPGFRDGQESFFDRYLQPFVMVAGAGIIVYLFFTVRS